MVEEVVRDGLAVLFAPSVAPRLPGALSNSIEMLEVLKEFPHLFGLFGMAGR